MQQKRASIVVIGIPWDDERVQHRISPEKLKKGIEMIGTLMKEQGFEHVDLIQYVFLFFYASLI